MYAMADVSRELCRSTVYLKHLQTAFALPSVSGAGYTKPYLAFLRKVVFLRTLSVSEEAILKLWRLEKKLMRLLNADVDRSPTWFLDQCGKRTHPRRRLLLTNYDTGTDLFMRKLQLGLPLMARAEELFEGKEMGEDVLRVLNDYLTMYDRIRRDAMAEIRIVRAAGTWANRLPQKMG